MVESIGSSDLVELPCPRSGSKPARDGFDGWPNDGRAEFFAPPSQGYLNQLILTGLRL